jgi:hypothetical protein
MPLGRSRIDIRTVPARGRSMPPQPHDVMAVIGPFNWGPMNEATVCIDFPDAYTKFGDLLSSYEAMLQLKLFFENGGRRAVVTRICHITDHLLGNTPATAAKGTYTLLTVAGGMYSALSTLIVNALYYGTLTVKVKVQDASNGEAARFDLLVYRGTELVEWFRNLSMLDTDSRYAEDVINTSSEASQYIRVLDQDVGGSGGVAADQRPANLSSAVTLTGGDNGLTALADADYVGASIFNTGLHAFTIVADGDKLVCPDNTNTTFQNSATTYCENEKKGKMLFITDSPSGTVTKTAVVAHAQALTASEYRTAVLWPNIKIANPNKTIYGQAPQIVVAPCGLYCARIAKNSISEEAQYFTQPGNEIYGLLDAAVDLETDIVLEPTVRDYVTDYGVNPIMKGIRGVDGNFGVWVDDVLLGKTTDNFVSVGEQSGVSYLRKVFETYMERHRTQSNTDDRRYTIEDALTAELIKWTGRGAFASRNPAEAFYVNADPKGESLNNPAVQDAQQLKVLIGLATARPGRFIELLFTRDSRAVESWIQQQLTANFNA